MYTAYLLPQHEIDRLKAIFPIAYSKEIAHHITEQFGVSPDTPPPAQPERVQVRGYVDSGDGLQALIVVIDGEEKRPDGNYYHITWSLEEGKYRPVDSNELVADTSKWVYVKGIIHIDVEPVTV